MMFDLLIENNTLGQPVYPTGIWSSKEISINISSFQNTLTGILWKKFSDID